MTAIHFKSSLRRVRTDDGQTVLTPKNTENHTNEHTVDLKTDPSVEMRSQIGLRTAHETTTQPTQRKQERKSALRFVLHCEQALLKPWLNGWLLCSAKKLCAVTIGSEITLQVWKTCHVVTCDCTLEDIEVEHVDILVAFCSNIFCFPSHPHLHTHEQPPLTIPSPFLCVLHTHTMYMRVFSFWGLGRQFLPPKTLRIIQMNIRSI